MNRVKAIFNFIAFLIYLITFSIECFTAKVLKSSISSVIFQSLPSFRIFFLCLFPMNVDIFFFRIVIISLLHFTMPCRSLFS